MNKKTILLCVMAVAGLLLLTACFPGNERYTYEQPAGFFWGIWHGLIAIITLIGSLFSDNVTIYESYNTGFFYNLGFLIGVASPIGGVSFFRD